MTSAEVEGTRPPTTEVSLVFLYITMNNVKMNFKKTIAFMRTSKRIKYSGINLTKEVHNLYAENYNTLLLKEIKENLNKWKDVIGGMA